MKATSGRPMAAADPSRMVRRTILSIDVLSARTGLSRSASCRAPFLVKGFAKKSVDDTAFPGGESNRRKR